MSKGIEARSGDQPDISEDAEPGVELGRTVPKDTIQGIGGRVYRTAAALDEEIVYAKYVDSLSGLSGSLEATPSDLETTQPPVDVDSLLRQHLEFVGK